jgi:hypothetical protein
MKPALIAEWETYKERPLALIQGRKQQAKQPERESA